MLKNYLLISFRNIRRNKGSALLNILCLSLGMSTFLFIFNYVQFEYSYDEFHLNADRIYRVETDTYFRQEIRKTDAFTPYTSGEKLKSNFTQIEDHCRLVPFSENGTAFIFSKDTGSSRTSFIESAYFSEASYFNIFSVSWLERKPGALLSQPNSLVISRSTAIKLFPKTVGNGKSVLGEVVEINTIGDNREKWIITGVYADIPENSHLRFGALFSLEGQEYMLDAGSESNTYTYVLVNDEYTEGMFQEELVDLEKLSQFSQFDQDFLSLKPITAIHTTTQVSNDPGNSANKTFIRFLLVIAIVILMLAATNYINSAIISSIERAKEIGVRKLVGIQPRQLIGNILTESISVNLVAGILALLLFVFGIKAINVLTDVKYPEALDLSALLNSGLVLLALIIFGALISGYYPASLLVNLKPVQALKGKTQVVSSKQSSKGSKVMRVLLVFQLTMGVVFISAVFIVQQQLSYVRQKGNKSFRMNITAKFPGLTGANDYYAIQSEGFVEGLIRKGEIESAYISNLYNGQVRMKQRIKALHQVGGDTTRLVDEFDLFVIDYHYWDGLPELFLAGRNFSKRFGFDHDQVIVNESALRAMRFNSPDSAIGKKVRPYNGTLIIKGVIKNDSINDIPKVYVTGLRYPTYIDMTFQARGSSAEKLNEAVTTAGQLWDKQFKGIYFLTRKYETQTALEKNLLKLFFFFTGVTVFIACLGVFSLSAFTTIKRTKEVGIRKVLGANVTQILLILIYDFMRLMILGSIIAVPLVILGARQWLQNYAFRINLHPGFALGPVAIMGTLAIIIIVRQSWSTSIKSPIKALSQE